MKTYFDIRERKIYALIDMNITHYEGYLGGWDERELKVNEINDIIKALQLLGKTVKRITISSHAYCVMDNTYYRRYPEEVINKIWNKMRNETEITIKGKRLYVFMDGYEIILPKDIYTDFDTKQLEINVYYEERR